MDWSDDTPSFQRLRQRTRSQGYKRRKGEAHLARDNAVQAAHDKGCTKRAYASKAEAEARIARANSTPGGMPKQLRHAYRCPTCRAFHMTSLRG